MAATDWAQTFEGKWSCETWTRADGVYRVEDRSASWSRCTARPYFVKKKEGARWVTAIWLERTRHDRKRLGLFATAQAAMAAIDKLDPPQTPPE